MSNSGLEEFDDEKQQRKPHPGDFLGLHLTLVLFHYRAY
jgi:hypothetical protein